MIVIIEADLTYRSREIVKGLCLLMIAVSAFTAAFSWFAVEQPGPAAWICRIGGIAVCAAAFVLFLYVNVVKGAAPAFLYEEFGEFFDCEGFCFVVTATAEDELCHFSVHFQNRHSAPCRVQIALRPSRRLFRASEDVLLTFAIDCPGGAFGETKVPVPVAAEYQGRTQRFDIAAGVDYPNGRGKTLWYRDGTFLRSQLSFRDGLLTTLTVVSAMTGSLWIIKPASVEITLPHGVATEVTEELGPTTTIHWVPDADSAVNSLPPDAS